MKKVLVLVLLFVFVSVNSLGSPLIFKIKKAVDTEGLVELGTFDATRYRQIRIGIKISGRRQKTVALKSVAEIELNAAERELKRKLELLEQGVISRSDYDITADRARIARLNYANAKEFIYPDVSVFGMENNEDFLLTSFDENSSRSILIDTPPSKISVKVSGKGIYSLYVWGQ